MDYALKKNRLGAYLFDLLLVTIIVSSGLSFLLFVYLIHPLLYVLIVIGVTYFVYLLFVSITLKMSKGLTLGGLLFKVRITQTRNKKLSAAQLLVRTSLQALLPIGLLDIYYLTINDTNLSPIDKITYTLVIEK